MQIGNSQVYTLENYHVIRETCYCENFLVFHPQNLNQIAALEMQRFATKK